MLRTLCFLILLLPSASLADETYRVRLQPREGTGATGSGTGTLILDRFQTELEFSITVTGLTSPEVGAHIHRPDGSIAFALPVGETKNGIWQGIGFGDLFLLQGEELYILVHTDANPGGELRGDIVLDTVPTAARSFGEIKGQYKEIATGLHGPQP